MRAIRKIERWFVSETHHLFPNPQKFSPEYYFHHLSGLGCLCSGSTDRSAGLQGS